MKRRISVVAFVAIMILLVMAPLFLTSKPDTLAIFRVTMVESELAGPPVWVIAPSDQVLAYGEHFDYQIVATDSIGNTPGISDWWINDTVNFELSTTYYGEGSTARIESKTILDPGNFGLWVIVYDLEGNSLSAIFRVTVVESELAGPPVWVIAPSNQVLKYHESFDYALVVMSTAGYTWVLNNTWDFEISPQYYDGGSTARIRNNTVLAPGDYGLSVEVMDINWHGIHSIFRVTVTRQLRLKLSGSFDYLLKEEIQLQLAGLLTDTFTGEPVSGATVNFDIYNPDGSFLVSGILLEHTKPGVYIYTMPDTMKDLKLPKGIYLVYAQATSPYGFEAVDMIQFHIDPPPGLELNALANTTIGMTALTAIGLVGVFIWRRRPRSLEPGS